jgi:hypothetical protein
LTDNTQAVAIDRNCENISIIEDGVTAVRSHRAIGDLLALDEIEMIG